MGKELRRVVGMFVAVQQMSAPLLTFLNVSLILEVESQFNVVFPKFRTKLKTWSISKSLMGR